MGWGCAAAIVLALGCPKGGQRPHPTYAYSSPFDVPVEPLVPDSSGDEVKVAHWDEGFTIIDQAAERRLLRLQDASVTISVTERLPNGGMVVSAQFRAEINAPTPEWSTLERYAGMTGQFFTIEFLSLDEGLLDVLITEPFQIKCFETNQQVVTGQQTFRIEENEVDLFQQSRSARITPKPYKWHKCGA